MITYTPERIAEIVHGRIDHISDLDHQIVSLLIDSRQLRDPATTLFFALEGERNDGHSFVKTLYSKGVKSFIICKNIDFQNFPQANFIVVEDTKTALQQLTKFHREQFDLPVIGITGSNGKTVVKEWLFQLLASDIRTVKSPKSYNSQVGVPLSIWGLHSQAGLGIFEAGISQTGEMAKIAGIIKPTIGLITNIGSAHDRGFSSRQKKLEEKLLLFQTCNVLVYCRDDRAIHEAVQPLDLEFFTWTTQDRAGANIQITSIKKDIDSTQICYKSEKNEGFIEIPFADQASLQNALHCLAILHLLDLPSHVWESRFPSLNPVAMRLEALEGINRCILINDVYNADLESLNVAMAFAHFQSSHKKKTLILTDLLQQKGTAALSRTIAGMINQHRFTKVMAVGSEIQEIGKYISPEISFAHFSTVEDLLGSMDTSAFQNEVILLKGSRVFGLERVTDRLSLRKHQTILEINLASLARNLKLFEDHLNRDTKIMAVVKADAYGSGGVEIARFLMSRHVDYLAVAYHDEGVELRKAGIETPIMVMNPELSRIDEMVDLRLEPEIFSLSQLERVVRQHKILGLKIPIHLKIETGMHRLGIDEKDLDMLGEIIDQTPGVIIKSVFSHLAASDDPEHDAFTNAQIRTFTELSERVCDRCSPSPICHLASSQAIVRHPDAHFDMVRIGIGMYGIGMKDFEKVHSLKTYVSQVKEVRPGETIGYGRAGEEVSALRLIATIAIGYADGLIRKAGNHRYAVIINDQRAPIVGNICMDMTMIDVTNISDVKIGTEVTVFGKDPDIEELAHAAETIPYEVFTSLSRRIKRIYIYE